MKILITGSHFTPAQAVIEELQKNSKVEIVYFGRKFTREGDKSPSVESEILPKLGVKFIPVIAGRLQRSFTRYTVSSLLKVPLGILQSFYLMVREQPNVILSFGGYVAVPTVISAWILSIPVIIHEQTLVSGLANTISSWFASKIAVSFPDNKSFDPNRTVVTGNPMRKGLFEINRKSEFSKIVESAKKEKLPLILITGGNQGSHVINEAVYEILEELNEAAFIIHQTGDSKFKDYERLSDKKNSLKFLNRYFVAKWISGNEIGFIFKDADLVVSRAGINTLLELAYFGVPTLVIPIPYIYKNEQMVNARFFAKAGLAKILPQSELTAERLLKEIKEMTCDLAVLNKRAQEAKGVVIPDAAKRLALETLLLAEKKI